MRGDGTHRHACHSDCILVRPAKVTAAHNMSVCIVIGWVKEVTDKKRCGAQRNPITEYD
jgi:hypothetical protein